MAQTTAAELLGVMSLRLKMQQDGTTNPSDSLKAITYALVSKLSSFPGKEKIAVEEGTSPILARYVRISTGEVLAEFHERQDT